MCAASGPDAAVITDAETANSEIDGVAGGVAHKNTVAALPEGSRTVATDADSLSSMGSTVTVMTLAWLSRVAISRPAEPSKELLSRVGSAGEGPCRWRLTR